MYGLYGLYRSNSTRFNTTEKRSDKSEKSDKTSDKTSEKTSEKTSAQTSAIITQSTNTLLSFQYIE